MTCRALFVNSGLLGHVSVGSLLRDAMRRAPEIEARHVDAGTPRTLSDRILRRVLCAAFAPEAGPAANVDLRRWRAELHSGLAAARRIRKAVAEGWCPDVLHFHTQAAAYGSLALMQGVPAVVSIDCTQTLARKEMHGPLARATYAPNIRRDRRVFALARAIVATSEWAASDLRREYPESAASVRVMPYPVRIPGAASEWIDARARRAPSSSPVRFLFVGGDFPRKGGWDLLDAWRACQFGDSATLDVVTDWRVPADRVPPGVRVGGRVAFRTESWDALWQGADVFVMPTRAEAFGMVFQEAAAAGLPSIGTNVAAVPELIEEGITGILVSPGEIRGLASALRSLREDAALRYRLGTAALARARTAWDLDCYARQLADVLLRSAGREVALA